MKHGIRYALGSATIVKKTCVKVILVTSNSWRQEDHGYVDAIKGLMTDFDDKDYKDVYSTFHCDEARIDIDSSESCSVWLLKTLGAFFSAGAPGRVYVDLTSAPKEWLFACNYVRAFFDDVHFYYVRGKREAFQDFTLEQRTDEGSAAEPVNLTGPNEILRWWVTPGDYRYELFKSICAVVSGEAKKLRKPPVEISVSIENVTNEWKKTESWTSQHAGDTSRSLGKHLAQIDQWKLFTRTPRTMRLTSGGLALGVALFPDILPPQNDVPESASPGRN